MYVYYDMLCIGVCYVWLYVMSVCMLCPCGCMQCMYVTLGMLRYACVMCCLNVCTSVVLCYGFYVCYVFVYVFMLGLFVMYVVYVCKVCMYVLLCMYVYMVCYVCMLFVLFLNL